MQAKLAIDCKPFLQDINMLLTSIKEIYVLHEPNKWIHADVESIEQVP